MVSTRGQSGKSRGGKDEPQKSGSLKEGATGGSRSDGESRGGPRRRRKTWREKRMEWKAAKEAAKAEAKPRGAKSKVPNHGQSHKDARDDGPSLTEVLAILSAADGATVTKKKAAKPARAKAAKEAKAPKGFRGPVRKPRNVPESESESESETESDDDTTPSRESSGSSGSDSFIVSSGDEGFELVLQDSDDDSEEEGGGGGGGGKRSKLRLRGAGAGGVTQRPVKKKGASAAGGARMAAKKSGDRTRELLALLEEADGSSGDDDAMVIPIPAKKITPEVMKQIEQIQKSSGSAPIEKEVQFFVEQSRGDQKTFLGLLENNDKLSSQIPIRFRILRSTLPDSIKRIALSRIESMFTPMGAMYDNEKAKQWVDNLLQIPFDKYKNLPINISHKPKKIQAFLSRAHDALNSALQGQMRAKEQILQHIGQLISNPAAQGTAIALVGPPGVGKTSIIREGFSKILKRPFSLISLGGATDSSTLIGHGQTYEGSQQGKIVEALISTNSMNPVFQFDELDKVSGSAKGEEVQSVLTHLTDPAQNDNFQDRQFSGVPIDMQRALFVFSLNDISKINPVLKDRIHVIEVDGQTAREKSEIARGFLIPKRMADFGMTETDLRFTEEAIQCLVNRHSKEKGVRGLSNSIRECISRINLIRLHGGEIPGDTKISQAKIGVAAGTEVTLDMLQRILPEKLDASMALTNMQV